jgi:glucose/arabinose dehydrogenase
MHLRRIAILLVVCCTTLVSSHVMRNVPSADAQQASSRTLPTSGTTTPPGPSIKISLVANASQPISVVSRPNDDALYVLEKTGTIRTLTTAGLRSAPVLDVRERVSTDNERGLIGLAFSPIDEKHLYVTYTERNGTIVVSEFAFDGNVATAERVLFKLAHPNNDHNGGALAFSNDGLLFVALGDGGGVGTKGGVGDKANNAQNLNVLYGKLLRIDPKPNGDMPYGIPSSNPFANGRSAGLGASKKARPEIFAYGLRNPWRFSISADGQIWIPDVGQSSWEELNRIPVERTGVNFGWRLREGMHAYRNGAKPRGAQDPIFEFPHLDNRCAIIGGTSAVTGPWSANGANAQVPNPSATTQAYYFGELCSGSVYQLIDDGSTRNVRQLAGKVSYLTSLALSNDGTLYATSLNGGVYRIDRM